ncbi:MAG: translation initiation factor IF-3 [Thermotogae bacterium]|nr:translation initiation factor IF-3 [Thermotogota bacterium]
MTINGNHSAKAAIVRLIGPDGKQLGMVDRNEALNKAKEYGLDLVTVAPDADPPVVKIMDYGKYRYEQSKKSKRGRKKQKKNVLKQIKFRPKIDEHDYETKLGHIIRFLKAGNKVKVTIMFRGREMAFVEQGRNILDRVTKDVSEIGIVESKPNLIGRDMFMTLMPRKN